MAGAEQTVAEQEDAAAAAPNGAAIYASAADALEAEAQAAEERLFPADSVRAVASRRSKGTEVSYGDKILKCEDLEQVDWSEIDLCLNFIAAVDLIL